MMRRYGTVLGLFLLMTMTGCSGDDDVSSGWEQPAVHNEAGLDVQEDQKVDIDGTLEDGREEEPDEAASPCPLDMVMVESWCLDRYEAPNREGELPLVMFHFEEAESWCQHRGKRLCFDDEWTRVCAGEKGTSYPYGDEHEPGICTDDKPWLAYDQDKLNGWPWSLETDTIESLQELLDAVREKGSNASLTADHVQSLYQAEPSGSKAGCTTGDGTFDLIGNVEEWTRRRQGSASGFHGNLKGRYWAETRTCQNSITTHGDRFRFYEIGFRCCLDLP